MTGEETPSGLAYFRNHKAASLELGVRRGSLKFNYYFGRHREELFNLDVDPGEGRTLVTEPPPAPPEVRTLVVGLQELLELWISSKDGTDGALSPSLTGVDSLDADTIEALRAIGYFGN